jgi:quinolinate synthase
MTDVKNQIEAIRQEQGGKLLILGHHYQRSSVLGHCDEKGDSLELARLAGRNKTAERIVFCGVKFMAESADVLSGSDQTVFMPDPLAGCPMAQMADAESMNKAKAFLQAGGGHASGLAGDWLPVVYVNSTAEIKAACGDWGGSTCTSSNSAKVFEWVFGQGKKVFFLPDEHLGWNTGTDLGVSDDEIRLYDPRLENGGLDAGDLAAARIIVWKGFCLVHQRFVVEHVEHIRHERPEAKIIVHPESPKEVVRICDAHGSTAQIIEYVEAAADGSTIVIGTEVNLVERLAEQHKGRVEILALSPSVCANMAKINENNLLDVLKTFSAESEVHVDDAVAANSKLALERMLGVF